VALFRGTKDIYISGELCEGIAGISVKGCGDIRTGPKAKISGPKERSLKGGG
jgi:hypothetical protein